MTFTYHSTNLFLWLRSSLITVRKTLKIWHCFNIFIFQMRSLTESSRNWTRMEVAPWTLMSSARWWWPNQSRERRRDLPAIWRCRAEPNWRKRRDSPAICLPCDELHIFVYLLLPPTHPHVSSIKIVPSKWIVTAWISNKMMNFY